MLLMRDWNLLGKRSHVACWGKDSHTRVLDMSFVREMGNLESEEKLGTTNK